MFSYPNIQTISRCMGKPLCPPPFYIEKQLIRLTGPVVQSVKRSTR